MKAMMQRLAVMVTLGVCITGLVGCGKREEAPNQEVQSAKATVRIGAILPLTGALSYFGEHERRAIDLAIRDANAHATNAFRYDVVYEDHKNDVKTAVVQFQRLLSAQNIRLFITQMSAPSMALAPMAKDSGAVLVSLAMHPDFAKQGPSLFRVYESITEESKALAYYIRHHRPEKRLGILYINDVWGIESAESFAKKHTSLGGTVTVSSQYASQDSDHRSLIATVLQTRPEAVFVAGYGPSAVGIVRQIREVSAVPIYGNIGLSWDFSFKASGGALTGVVVVMPQFLATEQRDSAFVEDFFNAYGSLPNMESAFAYDSLMMIVQAVEASRSDLPSIVAARLLATERHAGISGEIRMDAQGDTRMSSTAIREWQSNGELKTIMRFQSSVYE